MAILPGNRQNHNVPQSVVGLSKASVAAVINCSHGPAEPCPGGTLWRRTDPEVISNADIRDSAASDKAEVNPEEENAGET
ncbi:hypothetical protein NDU88_006520 [Pleurodeles waltl]|uniref:Uncharacterized protein n=1 Tax=Pleurodeles waltl TaxID=8319 RepID=A0AAV7TXB8_PLEWA|nr:hypothetical protein NDU88_006520 [Pleurodeles waltl]